jgi:hypothetical protein
MGALRLANTGRQNVTLERVQLLDVDGALELVGVLVVDPNGRDPLVGGDHGFPPPKPGGATHPVRGYQMAPGRSNSDFVQLLVGLRLNQRGRAVARRIAVDYRLGGTPYRAIFDDAMWICTDRDPAERCIPNS